MKNQIVSIVLILSLSIVSIFATEKEWRRVVINLGIPAYADKIKSEVNKYVGKDVDLERVVR